MIEVFPSLLGFFVRSVFVTELAEFSEFKTVLQSLFVLA